MKNLYLIRLVLGGALVALPSISLAVETGFSFADEACTKNEKWTLSQSISDVWKAEFLAFLQQKDPNIIGLTNAMALERETKNEDEKLLAIYWKNRALFEAGLIHVAANGFNWIAAQPVTGQSIGIQTAAIECLNRVYFRFPRIHMDAEVAKRLPDYRKFYRQIRWAGGNDQVLWDAAAILFRAQISENRPDEEVEVTLEFLKGAGGPYENLASGLYAAKKEQYDLAIKKLEAYLKLENLTQEQSRYRDGAMLTLGRAYYAIGKFDRAIEYFRKISKESNHMVRGLSEMAWSFLLNKEYKEAIGTALNFQTGGFQKTFAPDALMVLAMALNEFCQYPTALKSVTLLRQYYRPSYQWLKQWAASKKSTDLYQLALQHLETGKSDVPARVMSEWIRSPVFISHQEEMNLLVDERKAAKKLRSDLKAVYRARKDELIEVSKRLKDRKIQVQAKLREEKILAKRKNVDLKEFKKAQTELLESFKKDVDTLKTLKAKMERLRKSNKSIETVQNLYGTKSVAIEKSLIARVNADLGMRNAIMIQKLRELAENTYLIEVEIYNGASEDVVWQNAHPEYRQYASNIKKQTDQELASKIYNWGPPSMSKEGFTEIWADELGNMFSNVGDNCSNREKYLSVKFSPDHLVQPK